MRKGSRAERLESTQQWSAKLTLPRPSFTCPIDKLQSVIPEHFVERNTPATNNNPNSANGPIVPPDPFTSSQFSSHSPKQKQDLFVNELLNTKNSENEYSSCLKNFVAQFIEPIRAEDSDFKRTLMNDPAVASLFDVFQQIAVASGNFHEGLVSYQNDHSNSSPSLEQNLMKVLNEFAGALLLYAQYIGVFSEALSSLDKRARKLARYLKKNPLEGVLGLEQMLSLPQKQVDIYHFTVSKLLALDISQQGPLQSVKESITKVYMAIHKQETGEKHRSTHHHPQTYSLLPPHHPRRTGTPQDPSAIHWQPAHLQDEPSSSLRGRPVPSH